MTTQTKLITADELLMMPDDGYRYELLRGVLIQKMPPGNPHGYVVIWTSVEFGNYVRANNYGSVRAEIGYKLESDPDTVRAPDVSWIAPGRITESIPGYRSWFLTSLSKLSRRATRTPKWPPRPRCG